MEDVKELSSTITYSGSQSYIDEWTDYVHLISCIKLSLAYDALLKDSQNDRHLYSEHIAWHIIRIICIQRIPILLSRKKRTLLSEDGLTIGESIEKDRGIISGKLVYSIPSSRADSIKSEEDFNELFTHFHRYDKPYYYHPMWNEIKFAFDEWIHARNKIAELLDAHPYLSYREHTKEVIDGMFSFIKTLDKPYIRSILY